MIFGHELSEHVMHPTFGDRLFMRRTSKALEKPAKTRETHDDDDVTEQIAYSALKNMARMRTTLIILMRVSVFS